MNETTRTYAADAPEIRAALEAGKTVRALVPPITAANDPNRWAEVYKLENLPMTSGNEYVIYVGNDRCPHDSKLFSKSVDTLVDIMRGFSPTGWSIVDDGAGDTEPVDEFPDFAAAYEQGLKEGGHWEKYLEEKAERQQLRMKWDELQVLYAGDDAQAIYERIQRQQVEIGTSRQRIADLEDVLERILFDCDVHIRTNLPMPVISQLEIKKNIDEVLS